MRILIIPVRGGSKGIPNKNLQTVNGITLTDRAIRTSLKAKIDKLIVSTDSSEIKKFVTKYPGVIIHNRSESTSNDTASSDSVILEVINDLGNEWVEEETQIGIYQATSPFVEIKTINLCFEESEKGNVGFSAKKFHSFVWEQQQNWIPINHPEDYRPRRQELNEKVIESGAIYCFPLKQFKEKKYRFCSNPVPVMFEDLHSIEIDDKEELQLSNLIATQYEISNFKGFLDKPLPKVLFTDFDGCLTDDKVKTNIFGIESVIANRKDGLGVKRLKKMGIEVIITTAQTNNVVLKRAQKLNVKIFKDLENKANAIEKYLIESKLTWQDVWYLGNEVNDLVPLSKAALSFCPLDAAIEVFLVAQVVLSRKGGEGLLGEIASRLERKNIDY